MTYRFEVLNRLEGLVSSWNKIRFLPSAVP